MTTAQKTRINGVSLPALQSLIATAGRDETGAKTTFRVQTNWRGGGRTESRVDGWEFDGKHRPRRHAIYSDEPVELCGENSAPNPQELLMAGLNACMTVGYVAGCAIRGIELESLEIETHGSLDLRGFLGLDPNVKPGYREVQYTVRIRGNGTPEQFEEIHRTVMATSPNFSNFATPIRMVPHLEVV